MRFDITVAEATLFAVVVYDAVKAADPVMPSLVIMKTASKVDFGSDTLVEDVKRVVKELTEVPGDEK
jgi:hypothetical protein